VTLESWRFPKLALERAMGELETHVAYRSSRALIAGGKSVDCSDRAITIGTVL
jgi:hypothetical protein